MHVHCRNCKAPRPDRRPPVFHRLLTMKIDVPASFGTGRNESATNRRLGSVLCLFTPTCCGFIRVPCNMLNRLGIGLPEHRIGPVAASNGVKLCLMLWLTNCNVLVPAVSCGGFRRLNQIGTNRRRIMLRCVFRFRSPLHVVAQRFVYHRPKRGLRSTKQVSVQLVAEQTAVLRVVSPAYINSERSPPCSAQSSLSSSSCS